MSEYNGFRDNSEDPEQQFKKEVFPAELEEIRERRTHYHAPLRIPLDSERKPEPSASLGLVGLALSGGGIRSASFSLGVVQELARKQLLSKVDYMSTVSGGGYLGACLSSLLQDKEPAHSSKEPLAPENFPLRKEPGQPEPPALRHLRNGSNYLSPPGSFQALELPRVMVRGFILTLWCLLPFVAAAAAITSLYYNVGIHWLFAKGLHGPWVFLLPAVFFVLLSVCTPFLPRLHQRVKDTYGKVMSSLLLVLLLGLLCWPLGVLTNRIVTERAIFTGAWQFIQDEPWPVVTAVGVLGTLVLLIVLGATRLPEARRLLGKLGLTLAALIGPLLLFTLYLACLISVADLPQAIPYPLLRQCPVVLPEELRNALPKQVPYDLRPTRSATVFEIIGREGAKESSLGHIQYSEPRGDREGKLKMWPNWGAAERKERLDHLKWSLILLVAAGGMIVLNARLLNINKTSPHGFYRDQLSRLFLLREEGDETSHNDGMKLSELGGRYAPYHLLNATVNLAGSSKELEALRGRRGDFFIFSKHYCGSARTGWCKTKCLECVDPHVNLGTAMAISAAAVAPDMGTYTSRAHSLLLMLLNIRLNYWLPNPARLRCRIWNTWSSPGHSTGRVSPGYLLDEAIGAHGVGGSYVSVSDGGHLDNSGVYELLRRRCRLIIAVDADQDGELRFKTLARLMHYARIDLGAEISIDLESLRAPGGQHWVEGKVLYGNGEEGVLICIKSRLTGDERLDIRNYKERYPAFPHESTADQFFSEEQMEVYRALGEHSAQEASRSIEDWLNIIASETQAEHKEEPRPVAVMRVA